MRNIYIKKGWCFAVILLFASLSLMPITSSIVEKNESTEPLGAEGDNILAWVNVSWEKWPECPCSEPAGGKSSIEFIEDKIYYFPEDDDGNIKVNFSILCKHNLYVPLVFPFRWTHVEYSIWSGNQWNGHARKFELPLLLWLSPVYE